MQLINRPASTIMIIFNFNVWISKTNPQTDAEGPSIHNVPILWQTNGWVAWAVYLLVKALKVKLTFNYEFRRADQRTGGADEFDEIPKTFLISTSASHYHHQLYPSTWHHYSLPALLWNRVLPSISISTFGKLRFVVYLLIPSTLRTRVGLWMDGSPDGWTNTRTGSNPDIILTSSVWMGEFGPTPATWTRRLTTDPVLLACVPVPRLTPFLIQRNVKLFCCKYLHWIVLVADEANERAAEE